jgi:hypothetical protein
MGFIKLPTARKFSYRPRYYDPELEKLRERRAQRHSDEDENLSIKSGFARIRNDRKAMQTTTNTSRRIIFFVTLLFLTGIFYFVFKFTNLFNIFFK